ncbi:MAG TPA: outer membrane protein assembly factor BamD [Longimicrobiales bacterium]|nr:outer membrane protein assembly factor BamD [Longimicrobiales bacterium]
MTRPGRLILILPVVLSIACASRGPSLEGLDGDALFALGMEELERRRWESAAQTFERLIFTHPNHPRVAEARFRIGETYQGRREWLTAALEFNRLAAEFPAGAWADDARFQVCRSYYEMSPPPQLDQEYTHQALDHCQSLLIFYPESEFVPEAEAIIEEMVNRLAEKEYLIGEDYYRRRAFDSAAIYYDALAREYPMTRWAPRALLRLVQIYDRLGYEPEARSARDRLLQQFPDSPEAQQVRGAAAAADS